MLLANAAGDLTDAGEVAIMLLEYLHSTSGKYSFDGYANYWKAQIDAGYGSCNFQSVGRLATSCPPGTKPGYLNGGTRRTLDALSRQPGARGKARKQLAADVNCLVAATHFLPLFLASSNEKALVSAAKSTVYLSHKNRDSLAAAEFLARTLYNVIYGKLGLEEALIAAAEATKDQFISRWVDGGFGRCYSNVQCMTNLASGCTCAVFLAPYWSSQP